MCKFGSEAPASRFSCWLNFILFGFWQLIKQSNVSIWSEWEIETSRAERRLPSPLYLIACLIPCLEVSKLLPLVSFTLQQGGNYMQACQVTCCAHIDWQSILMYQRKPSSETVISWNWQLGHRKVNALWIWDMLDYCFCHRI